MVRYSLLRVLLFFGCLSLLWLLGLRSRENEVWLVAGAALLSLAISFVVLRPFRNQASESLQRRLDTRREAIERKTAATGGSRDAVDEDAEDEQVRTNTPGQARTNTPGQARTNTPDDFR